MQHAFTCFFIYVFQQRCSVVSCVLHEKIIKGEEDFNIRREMQITKMYEHECSCCIYNSRLVKNGEWIINAPSRIWKGTGRRFGKTVRNSSAKSHNLTCIKGKLYQAKEVVGHNDAFVLPNSYVDGNFDKKWNEYIGEEMESVSDDGEEDNEIYESMIISENSQSVASESNIGHHLPHNENDDVKMDGTSDLASAHNSKNTVYNNNNKKGNFC